MSERGTKPDIESRSVNVAEVPELTSFLHALRLLGASDGLNQCNEKEEAPTGGTGLLRVPLGGTRWGGKTHQMPLPSTVCRGRDN
jgi:hypothetical protein